MNAQGFAKTYTEVIGPVLTPLLLPRLQGVLTAVFAKLSSAMGQTLLSSTPLEPPCAALSSCPMPQSPFPSPPSFFSPPSTNPLGSLALTTQAMQPNFIMQVCLVAHRWTVRLSRSD